MPPCTMYWTDGTSKSGVKLLEWEELLNVSVIKYEINYYFYIEGQAE